MSCKKSQRVTYDTFLTYNIMIQYSVMNTQNLELSLVLKNRI